MYNGPCVRGVCLIFVCNQWHIVGHLPSVLSQLDVHDKSMVFNNTCHIAENESMKD